MRGRLLRFPPAPVVISPSDNLFLGLQAFEAPSAPRLTKPMGRWMAACYLTQVALFWELTPGAPPESYRDAWLYAGPDDPMD